MNKDIEEKEESTDYITVSSYRMYKSDWLLLHKKH